MGDYVGKAAGERDVNIAESSPNRHIILSGISGSGKSMRTAELETKIVKDGGTVLEFDVNGTHSDVEAKYCNHISAVKDGLAVNFLDTTLVELGEETSANLVGYIMDTICPKAMRGARQKAAVREAIKFAIGHRNKFSTEMEAIAEGLKMQTGEAAAGAYDHLFPILEGEIFRKSVKTIREGVINIISLKGINPGTQKIIIEIMLNIIWRQMRIDGPNGKGFTLVIDEFQNLNLNQGSVLFQMLTEARKYNVRLILATQTLLTFSRKDLAVINQAAVRLFFRQNPSDAKHVAALIEPNHNEKWISELIRLPVGQAITLGELELCGRTLHRPIITHLGNSKYGRTLPGGATCDSETGAIAEVRSYR